MNPFTSGLKIEAQFSKQLFVVLNFFSILAVLVVIILPLQIIVKSVLVLFILIWLIRVINQHCRHQPPAIQQAMLRSDNSWLLSFADTEPLPAELMPACFVQPWLTVLQFQLANKNKASLILLRDNVDPDTFRRLRVRLMNGSEE